MNRWLAPWAAALRIARRQALRAKARTALSAVMVGLPLMAIAGLAVVVLSVVPSEATLVQHTLGDEAQAYVKLTPDCVPYAQHPNETTPGMCGLTLDAAGNEDDRGVTRTAEETEALLRSLGPGVTLVREHASEALLAVPGANNSPLPVRTVDTSGPLASTVRVVEGRVPTAAGEIGLRDGVARRLGIALGDQVDLVVGTQPFPVTVTALLSSTDTYVVAAPGTLPDDDGDLVAWYVLGGPVTWDHVLELNLGGASVISRHVLEHPPASTDVPAHVMETRWSSSDSTTAVMVGLVAALVVLEVVLLVGPAFAVGARRNARSIALVAATGGTRRDLRRIVLAHGVVVGLGAAGLAVGLGVLGGAAVVLWPHRDRWSPFPNLVVPPWIAGLVALGTVIAVLAAWLPARHAARIDVTAALAGRRAEARTRSGVGIVGLVVAALGVPVAGLGGRSGAPAIATVGGVLVVLGLVAASGLLVSAAGRFARRAGVATRIALRDLARQRSRTAPAAAAILGAIAAATAGAVYTAASAAHSTATWIPETDVGTVKVRLHPWAFEAPGVEDRELAVIEAIHELDPGAEIATLHAAVPSTLPPREASWSVYPEEDPARVCPLYLEDSPSEERRAELADDPRCTWRSAGWGYHTIDSHFSGVEGLLVDDGTVFEIIAGQGAPEIAEALAAGRAIAPWYASLWGDGSVRLLETGTGSDRPLGSVSGTFVESHLAVSERLVLPPSALDTLDVDFRLVPVNVVARPSAPWSGAQARSLQDTVTQLHPELLAQVETRPEQDVSSTVLAVVAAAGLVALAATWIASGLAAVESRADLATLSAVGASPRVRRRVAGLQSGFLTLTGVIPGIAGGLAVGWALVTAAAGLGTEMPDPAWQMVVPWTVLAAAVVVLPLLAGGVTALFTPSKLPLTRRPAE